MDFAINVRKNKMAEKITKKDFEMLYEIEFLNMNSIKSLSVNNTEKAVKIKLKEFEKKGWINFEKNHPELFFLAKKGKDILNDDQYNGWKEEIGY